MLVIRSLIAGLAVAVGLATQTSAATWRIDFFDPVDTTTIVGTAAFTANTPTVSQPQVFPTGVTATIRGMDYTPEPTSLLEFTLLAGEFVLAATFGTPNDGIFVAGLFDPDTNTGRTVWEPYQCLLPFATCTFGAQGTYTVTRTSDPEPPVIPLPATAALLPLGLVALGALRRRRKA